MEEKEIDLIDIRELLYNIWQKKMLIVVLCILGIILSVVYTRFMVTPMYKSRTSLVLAGSSNKEDASITANDLTMNSKLVSTYGEIVKSRTVAEHVINELGLSITENTLINSITIASKTGSDIIEISVSNKSGKEAADIANKIAEVFIEKVKEIYNLENVSIIDKAIEPVVPYNVSLPKNVVIFAVGGIVLACAIIFVSMIFDTTVKGQEDVERLLGVPVIAVIPKMED